MIEIDTYKVYILGVDCKYNLLGSLDIPFALEDVHKIVAGSHYLKFALVGIKKRSSLFLTFRHDEKLTHEKIDEFFKTPEQLKSNPKYDFYGARRMTFQKIDLYCETNFVEIFDTYCK